MSTVWIVVSEDYYGCGGRAVFDTEEAAVNYAAERGKKYNLECAAYEHVINAPEKEKSKTDQVTNAVYDQQNTKT